MASRFLSPAYEVMASAASPVINFGRGILGYQDPFLTQTMQDRMLELEAQKGPSGSIGYEDYGLPVSAPGGRFTGGLPSLLLSNPIDFGLAGSVGRYGYGPDGRTGLKYDFTPDQDTGSTGSGILDFINRGGVKNYISNLDLFNSAVAAENQAGNYRRLMTQPGLDKFTDINKGVYDPYGIKTEDGRFSYNMNKTSLADYQTMAPQQTFQDYYSGIYEPYDPEKDDEQVDYLPGQYSFKDRVGKFAKNIIGQPGISSLIGLINPVAGLVSRGLGYLGGNLSPSFVGPKGARGYGSESVGGLFARSNTLADFVQNVRDKRARDAAAARGAAKQAEQARMNAFRAIRDSQPSGGGGGGGIGSSYGGSASPGSQGPGGSDAMGSF